jgi:hypothetical protein
MEQEPRNFQFSSDYPMPYFIYKTEQSVAVPSTGTNTVIVPHGLSFIPLLVGQWSPNQNFDVTHDITNSASVDMVYVWCFADDTNIYIRQFNGTDHASTVYVKIYAYAPPEYNGDLQPLSDETAFNFDTDYTYLGIFKAGYIESDNQEHIIPHDLGYVPQCKIWCGGQYAVDGRGELVPAIGPQSSYVDYTRNLPNYVIDENNLTIGMTYATDGKIYYHIYTNEA